MRYDLYFADGTKRVNRPEQIFPDRVGHWPRLLYHRHFMLTEFINDFAPEWAWPPGPSSTETLPSNVAGPTLQPVAAQPTPPGEALPTAASGPPHVATYVRAMADYLARKHNATRVDVYYRKHLLPSIEDFNRVGRKLDSPESYRDRLLLSYTPESRS